MHHHMTLEERRILSLMRQAGDKPEDIAKRLGRHSTTISREVERNSGKKGYCYKQAHAKAQARAKRDVPRRFTLEMKAELERGLLYKEWSPHLISTHARAQGRPFVCKETLYQYIYAEGKAGGRLWTLLTRSHKQRWRRCPHHNGRGRGRIRNQRMIDTRPAEVDDRSTFGHWEGDLINGASGTGHLVTLVERKTRYTLIARTQTKEAKAVKAVIVRLFSQLPSSARRSVTFDNGKEFASHEKISKKLRMDVFFAHPYHSWERGTNENVNGLIRRQYPKRSSFAAVDGYQLWQLERYVNERPRECLSGKTPREEITAFLGFAP